MKKMSRVACAVLLPLMLGACHSLPGEPLVADLGNGRFKNPVLHAHYSDPDTMSATPIK